MWRHTTTRLPVDLRFFILRGFFERKFTKTSCVWRVCNFTHISKLLADISQLTFRMLIEINFPYKTNRVAFLPCHNLFIISCSYHPDIVQTTITHKKPFFLRYSAVSVEI